MGFLTAALIVLQAMDAILMKRLTYDRIQICRKTAIIFLNDGKAAFD